MRRSWIYAMTLLLRKAINELEKLPPDLQDGIAARLLLEIEDEAAWGRRFEATSSQQWSRMAEAVRLETNARKRNL